MSDPSYTEIKTLIKRGRYFKAYNQAEKLLLDNPDDVPVRQQYALALARLGLLEKARVQLLDLYKKFPNDPETAGILGSVLKTIYKKSGKKHDAVHSRDIYLENYRKNKNYYTGINAASMSVVVGDHRTASEIAAEIIHMIDAETDEFWEQVTMGEAFLLLGDKGSAISWYSRAGKSIKRDYGVFSSVFKQLILLEGHIEVPEELKTLFKPPAVVVFTGHMIDHPDRLTPRFPESKAEIIREKIAHILEKLDAGIGYSSLACGADILFVEEMIKRGAEVNLFLPYNLIDFVETSVSFAGNSWLSRFRDILDAHSFQYITEEGYYGNDDLHALLGSVIFGKSLLRAESLDAQPALLTVLTPSGSADQPLKGGTEYLVNKWPFKEHLYSINPAELLQPSGAAPTKTNQGQSPEPTQNTDREIRHILFADVVGYSKLSEDKTPFFVGNLMRDIAGHISALSHSPEILNTWGDSIFAVYSDIREMMEFALAVQTAIVESSWKDVVDARDLSMRIALHTGPVFLLDDPLTRRRNAFGNHINRAARMEPVTHPGSIYASDQFASVLKIACYGEYDFEYVGIIDLPKEFGQQEMYRVGPLRND